MAARSGRPGANRSHRATGANCQREPVSSPRRRRQMDKAMRTLPLLALLALLAAPTALAASPTGGTATTPPPGGTTTPPPSTIPVDEAPQGTAFDGAGMWVWYLSQSNGGNLDKIAARARKA